MVRDDGRMRVRCTPRVVLGSAMGVMLACLGATPCSTSAADGDPDAGSVTRADAGHARVSGNGSAHRAHDAGPSTTAAISGRSSSTALLPDTGSGSTGSGSTADTITETLSPFADGGDQTTGDTSSGPPFEIRRENDD